MECRVGCGACCIAPSITSSIPGMPNGKPAGVRCTQLSDENQCLLFDSPDRPAVCIGFNASKDICGENFEEAMQHLLVLEKVTSSKN
ncbi:YkgJ family cysteine cluster protein [Kaarinaea lacus]